MLLFLSFCTKIISSWFNFANWQKPLLVSLCPEQFSQIEIPPRITGTSDYDMGVQQKMLGMQQNMLQIHQAMLRVQQAMLRVQKAMLHLVR